MLEKRAWAMKRLDHLRRGLILEPRGHTDMYGALLTEPVTRDAHAGVLFMHNEGWSTMCGHGIIAVTTIAIERGLIWPGGAAKEQNGGTPSGKPTSVEIRYDTPAGLVQARAHLAHYGDVGARRLGRVPQRRVVCVRAVAAGHGGGKKIPVDVAFGGAFYAIVDSEAAGVPIDPAHLPELRTLGMTIAREVEKLRRVVHPNDPGLEGIYGTIFTAPAQLARRALAQRHDLRGCRGRSITVRHRYRGGDGGAQRHGPAARRCAVRSREHRRHHLPRPRGRSRRGG